MLVEWPSLTTCSSSATAPQLQLGGTSGSDPLDLCVLNNENNLFCQALTRGAQGRQQSASFAWLGRVRGLDHWWVWRLAPGTLPAVPSWFLGAAGTSAFLYAGDLWSERLHSCLWDTARAMGARDASLLVSRRQPREAHI